MSDRYPPRSSRCPANAHSQNLQSKTNRQENTNENGAQCKAGVNKMMQLTSGSVQVLGQRHGGEYGTSKGDVDAKEVEERMLTDDPTPPCIYTDQPTWWAIQSSAKPISAPLSFITHPSVNIFNPSFCDLHD